MSQAPTVEGGELGGRAALRPRATRLHRDSHRWPLDWLALGALLLLAVLARPLGYLFSHAFWLDEGWVADSVRAPLRQLRLLSSSTPIGWTLLLRLVPPVGPPERLRLLPLAFGVACVVPAYLLGRRLGRPQAVAAGTAAALAPALLANGDLKQYTADAFVALLLVWLAARLEAAWSPGRLAVLCAVCVPSMLTSHTTLFVSAALLVALAVRWLAERRWDRLAWVAGLGSAVGVAQGAIYLAISSAGDNQAMRRWWSSSYVPRSGPGAAGFVGGHLAATLGRAGFGPWALAAGLVVAGIVALWRARLRAVALTVPVLLAGLVAAGAARRYPFLDERTSLFFNVLLTVCAGLGVGALVAWACRRPATVPVAAVLAAGAALLLVPAARRAAAEPMPGSTVRQQVDFVLAHRRPGDVVVVGRGASFAFAYYWPDPPAFVPTRTGSAVLFQPEFPGRTDLLVNHRNTQDEADAAIRAASARTRSGRVWVVLAEAGDGGPKWHDAAPTARRANGGRLPLLLEVPSARP